MPLVTLNFGLNNAPTPQKYYDYRFGAFLRLIYSLPFGSFPLKQNEIKECVLQGPGWEPRMDEAKFRRG